MIKIFSMFSGVGGFELGFQQANLQTQVVGFCEIDKYASQILETKFQGVKNYGDATTIDETKLPNFDILVGGFPCQAFSMAGKRKGFDEARGTLFLMSQGFLPTKNQGILYSKMLKVYFLTTKEKLSRQYLGFSPTWGISLNGNCSIVRTTESHRVGKECILSDILEDKVDQKYFLSEKEWSI